MIIIGIDPGSRKTGYGVISLEGNHCRCLEYGAIRPPNVAFPERLRLIHAELTDLLARHTPAAVVVEEIFHHANVQSALLLGQTRGIVILAAAQAGVPLAEYSALQIKKSVVGYGKADKTQVQLMVTKLLNLKNKPKPLDASDALAMALCHAFNKGRYQHIPLRGGSRR
ncbi:MAG TPA: crossover junction endodeoxyribonuclease RuvC [Acidobacteriota bacterium]|nr:crossover junction endodeoxyribonuclease RuvC [Acidobacteriota bacterium]